VTDLSHDGTDDGFHEIQLSGKQLVFLFMATTVVSVVIFLCGVLVGRGVRGEALSAGSTPTVAPPSPSSAPAQPGIWAVQVVALTDRAAASAVVQRLSSKGYPAFLVTPQSGSAVQNYKVQVGRFEDRSQAELTAGRLKKEEQFQPWILR